MLGSIASELLLGQGDSRLTLANHAQPSRNRSEEHTSELQSLTNLVCRLLLEKKYDRALVVLRRVQGLHPELYPFDRAAVAYDRSRMGGVYAEQKKIDDAIIFF